MTAWLVLLMSFSVGLSAMAQTLFKFGVSQVQFTPQMSLISKAASMLLSPYVLTGIGLYALGTVAWLFALKKLDLSAAYPFVALSFILVAFLSFAVLGEPPSKTRLLGTSFIVLGLVFIFAGEIR
ncbi:MAG: EamA family transporter [Shimia sp.]|jgi:drug/metabolite transporter (DMT)-like permease|uniref:EamA family transporter n=1 Tax=Shimia sp. TaxID=1954381 RepID=UPI001B0D5CF7|nr:EamA family transporter [Shimia sp.]MBO6899319.1 EamA family transporter [Shimia sp.]|tara:strand:+ start:476 stop:850 length:375 start_codon:yes stop_codon:yes gene_type:complete|mmetsp:Transcript_23108/g.39405  ORF Transcript_23108/g.39405 Transcript_23108/m.39405 type:complete len:125 (-) Transcript_23108:276-650(-)